MDRDLEIAKETVRLYQEDQEGLHYNAALRKAKEMYKKAQSPATKQGKEHRKLFNDIIPDNLDIDNEEL